MVIDIPAGDGKMANSFLQCTEEMKIQRRIMVGGYRERTLGGRKQMMGNSGCKKRIKGAGKRGLIQGEGYGGEDTGREGYNTI